MNAAKKRNFKCEICGKAYSERYNFNVHRRSHDSVLPFKCEECDRSFNYKHVLKEHTVLVHSASTKNSHKCPRCPYTSKRKQDLDRHLNTCGTGPKQVYPCSSCELVFTHPSNLRRHVGTVHARGDEYVCHICGRFFATAAKLKMHLDKLHTNSVECCVCEKSFQTPGKLKIHQSRNHTASVGLNCPLCEYVNTTENPERLRRHIRETHGPKKKN